MSSVVIKLEEDSCNYSFTLGDKDKQERVVFKKDLSAYTVAVALSVLIDNFIRSHNDI